jgi:probable F420-dependent oxidoreductase
MDQGTQESGASGAGPAPGAGVRWGVTVPLDGLPLPGHREVVEGLAELGYGDLWSAEVNGSDAFTPLALAAAWSPALRLGTAIVPAATRGPALLAMSAAAMAEAAPGRFALGIGASSEAIVARWNAASFDQPFRRTRDTLRFVKRALAGERIDEAFETFTVRGFRLARVPPVPPPVLLAALRPGMLRLAGREADGAITNLLAAGDVPKVAAELHEHGQGKELVARLFVCPTDDLDYARTVGRRLLSTYLNVRVYAEFHRWLGRGEALGPTWSAWAAGDLRGANAAIPDEVVDELLIHGTPEQCRAHLERYVDAGITTPVLALLPTEPAPGGARVVSQKALKDLAPAARAYRA